MSHQVLAELRAANGDWKGAEAEYAYNIRLCEEMAKEQLGDGTLGELAKQLTRAGDFHRQAALSERRDYHPEQARAYYSGAVTTCR